jgi:hypothetical protein
MNKYEQMGLVPFPPLEPQHVFCEVMGLLRFLNVYLGKECRIPDPRLKMAAQVEIPRTPCILCDENVGVC